MYNQNINDYFGFNFHSVFTDTLNIFSIYMFSVYLVFCFSSIPKLEISCILIFENHRNGIEVYVTFYWCWNKVLLTKNKVCSQNLLWKYELYVSLKGCTLVFIMHKIWEIFLHRITYWNKVLANGLLQKLRKLKHFFTCVSLSQTAGISFLLLPRRKIIKFPCCKCRLLLLSLRQFITTILALWQHLALFTVESETFASSSFICLFFSFFFFKKAIFYILLKFWSRKIDVPV